MQNSYEKKRERERERKKKYKRYMGMKFMRTIISWMDCRTAEEERASENVHV
jgi:coproporphyrinogen III oxidase-like Fe-S oxidoreductase